MTLCLPPPPQCQICSSSLLQSFHQLSFALLVLSSLPSCDSNLSSSFCLFYHLILSSRFLQYSLFYSSIFSFLYFSPQSSCILIISSPLLSSPLLSSNLIISPLLFSSLLFSSLLFSSLLFSSLLFSSLLFSSLLFSSLLFSSLFLGYVFLSSPLLI